MSEIFEEIVGLDKIIHEPARLAILTALTSCASSDFTFLQRLTGLTQGNLSGHLLKLEEAGLIAADKQIVNKRTNTTIRLTAKGKTAIEKHWGQLERLRASAKVWDSESNK